MLESPFQQVPEVYPVVVFGNLVIAPPLAGQPKSYYGVWIVRLTGGLNRAIMGYGKSEKRFF